MKPPVFALVDCNNFYASCEKLFRPDLRHTPVVVLSNNDGCVVACSKEARALGIRMGVPAHHIKHEIRRYGIQVFSSNYRLYGDMSRRVMTTLEALAPRVDVYSIDEAFLDLTGVNRVVAFEDFGREIKDTVYRHVGLPVCVGVAPTRTLAKLANYAAKRYPATGGVVDLTGTARQKRLMARVAVGDVWGVGRRITARLENMGITTALQLAEADPALLRKRFSVVLERTARELNGISCLPWEAVPQPKKQVMCSRSFGQPLTGLGDLEEAVAHFASRVCEKLRAEDQYAGEIMVFIRTSPFRPEVRHYSGSATTGLSTPSQDTRVIVDKALKLLRSVYRQGCPYIKAGVLVSELTSGSARQADLFEAGSAEAGGRAGSDHLMALMDQVNRRSRGTLITARQAGNKAYAMRRAHLSPAYTTNWHQLPGVS